MRKCGRLFDMQIFLPQKAEEWNFYQKFSKQASKVFNILTARVENHPNIGQKWPKRKKNY